MTNEEARFLLQGYPADGSGARDPQFAEALEQVQRDPGLRRWFEEQQAFDQAVAGKLQSLPVPAGLKAEILAGCQTVPVRAWWRRRAFLVSLAACLAGCLAIAALWIEGGKGKDFAGYRSDMVRFVMKVEQGREPLDLTSGELSGIRDWIASHSDMNDLTVPEALTRESGVGCRVTDWAGSSVVLVCFRLASDEVAHLVVIDRADLRGRPTQEDGVVLASVDGVGSVAWADGPRTYLIVSRAPKAVLRGLL